MQNFKYYILNYAFYLIILILIVTKAPFIIWLILLFLLNIALYIKAIKTIINKQFTLPINIFYSLNTEGKKARDIGYLLLIPSVLVTLTILNILFFDYTFDIQPFKIYQNDLCIYNCSAKYYLPNKNSPFANLNYSYLKDFEKSIPYIIVAFGLILAIKEFRKKSKRN